ncbi:MAG: LysR family transcriptional regulator [Terracidiphilus sp.]
MRVSIYSMYSVSMDTTLDAWEILQAVVQLGGFAPAAEKLHRSQSTVSYAIGRLQEQLGIQFFEMQGRKAQLTEVGRVLLADAEPYLDGFHQLEQRARLMASGGASEVRLSVDSLFPDDRLFAALAAFSHQFPHVRPKLRQGTFLSADAEFSLHNAQICVTGLISREMFVRPILVIEMIAVVQRDHPLLSVRRRLSRSDLVQHILVTIEGSASGSTKQQPRLPAQRVLTVGSIESAIAAVRSGLCFGWLPKYRIQTEIDGGDFVELSLPAGQTRSVQLNLVCKDLSASNSEANVLADLLGMNRALESI